MRVPGPFCSWGLALIRKAVVGEGSLFFSFINPKAKDQRRAVNYLCEVSEPNKGLLAHIPCQALR